MNQKTQGWTKNLMAVGYATELYIEHPMTDKNNNKNKQSQKKMGHESPCFATYDKFL